MEDIETGTMSFLTEPLKKCVTVSGKSYAVNTDFKVWLEIQRLVTEDEGDLEKVTKAIILCYKGGVLPPSFFEAAGAMWDFLAGDEPNKKGEAGRKTKKIFDFTQDAELIYSSFLYDYGIDLESTPMHWHKFLALFKNLSAESPFMRVARLRATDLSEIKDANLKKEIRRRQRFFALEGSEAEEFEENLALLM